MRAPISIETYRGAPLAEAISEVAMNTLTSRLLGTAQLNARSYEEVEGDIHANAQAVGIVILSSIAAAVGAGAHDGPSAIGLLLGVMLTWILWVFLTLVIGTRLLPERQTRADFGQILRTTGFSAAPGLLRVFGVVPVVGHFIFAAATVWMLFTFVVAIRQALDYTSTARALAVCLLGWLIHGLLLFGFVMTAV
jgi:hypothetical protein